jgi:hypothetical protein
MVRCRGLGVAVLMAWTMGAAGLRAEGPVWGSNWASGQTLPLRWGASLTVYEQRQPYDIDRLTVGVPGFDQIPTERLAIDNRVREFDAQVDVWLLPFLDVFALGGKIDGRTVVDFSALDLGFPLGSVTIAYDGEVYGGGATLVAGTERAFASLTAVWTQTHLSGDFDSSADAFVATPRFGLHDERGSLWLGAMYQRADEKHRGTVVLPFLGRVPFSVALRQKDDWNGMVGMSAALDGHWQMQLEGGFGNRRSATATVTYRF